MDQSLETFSPSERLKQYRQFAEHAFQKAGSSPGMEQKAEFIAQASLWHALAADLQRLIERQSEDDAMLGRRRANWTKAVEH